MGLTVTLGRRAACLIAVSLFVGGCANPVDVPSPRPTSAAPPRLPTASPSYVTEFSSLGESMVVSPDGRTVLSFTRAPSGEVSLIFHRTDGAVVGRYSGGFRTQWLPDSGGVFVELAAQQRAGPLGIVGTDGRLVETSLDFANPALSPDGLWVAAERQEGCCAGIGIHEIRVALRAGGPARTLITSTDPALQPVSLLGWTPRGEVVYRDGQHIRSVTLGGVITEYPIQDTRRSAQPVAASTSPDHRVILACSAEPLIWRTIADGSVRMVPEELQAAWTTRPPFCSRPDEVFWIGDHDLPVRDASGALLALDG